MKNRIMAYSTSKKLLIGLGIICAVVCGQIIILSQSSFQTKAIVMRANFVVIMETVIFLFSFLIWRTTAYIFDASYLHESFASNSNGNGDLTSAGLFGRGQLRKKSKNSDIDLSTFDRRETASSSTLSISFLWKLILLFYLGVCHVSYFTNLFLISKDPHWFSMLTYACLGSFIQLNTGLLMFKSLSYILKLSSRHIHINCQLTRKKVAVFSLVYMLCASSLGLYKASQPPVVSNVEISIHNLPKNLEGLSIVQLSDIHLGPTVGFVKLEKIVEIVNGIKPDIVVLTGDLVDSSVQRLGGAATPLGSVRSKYGNFFATGNHEYYTGDVDNWFQVISSLGFTVLHNSHVVIPSQVSETEGQICLAGTDDVQADKIGYGDHKFDLGSAVGSCSQERPVILLAHQPAAAKIALDSKYRIDLVLSGHTHGGQIFPMIIGAYLLNPFYAGLYEYGGKGRYVYVSQGTQYWGIPMRIATSMEVTRIVLHASIP